MSESTPPTTKETLVTRINERWDALSALVSPLSDQELEKPLGDGWSVKVHLAHISAWETSLIGLLRKQDRPAAMGVPPEIWEGHDTDAINELLARRAEARTAGQVRNTFVATHADLMTLLDSMTTEDLNQPYSHYQPWDSTPNANPVAGWVHGNTWDHYNEHIGWITSGFRVQ